jgi:hypothetical protein
MTKRMHTHSYVSVIYSCIASQQRKQMAAGKKALEEDDEVYAILIAYIDIHIYMYVYMKFFT